MILVAGLPHNNFEWKSHCLEHQPLRFFGYKDQCWLNFKTPMDALAFMENTRFKTFQESRLGILAAHMASPEDFEQFATSFLQWVIKREHASFYDIKP